MRDPVKLLGFGFLLFFLNCTQCQECFRENIEYENTEPVEKASYADDQTVKVNCMTGYTGFYKLKCEKGEWKKTIGRPCAKKKCNHPGDTPNGDFELTEGTEFVFGATVVYKCNKGYEMASRINQRTCRAQGWDNTVPVCEVVKCPAIRTDEEVTASGNTEEGSYGDVIRFECVSSDKMIDGSSEIHCEETGKWSAVVPKCKDITCTAPVIPNGNVVDKQPEYKKGAPLNYKCDETFKPREGIPKCAKFGWTLRPECDEVNCVLKSTTFGVKIIIPYGKTIFRARESVDITCSEKHWLFGTKETKKRFTCKDNGEWDNEPVCAEITCDDPRDQLVSRPYFWGTMKLGEKQSYTCVYGYRGTEAEATCTRDGWTPKPLCTEIVCAAPNIPNADIVGLQRSNYKINSRIQYKCRSGFEPEESVQITCDREGQWRGIKQCTEMCAAPTITNAEIERGHRSYYRIYSNIQYKCRSGFEPEKPVQITCDREGQWRDIQQCTKMCATPTITNAEIEGGHKSYYKIYSNIQYKCHPGFEPEEFVQITCDHEGQWRGIKQCSEMCAAPNITNAEIEGPQRSYYRINSSIQYNCHPGFEPEESVQITCESQGHWTSIPQCSEMLCPNLSVENGFIYIDPSNKKEILYSCDPGYKPFTGNWWDSVTCRKGSLSGEARCIRKEECGALPSVHHGKLTLRDQDTADVECDPGFMSTEHSIKCTNGRWEKPVCKGCGLPPSVENAVITSKPEEFYVNGSNVTYACRTSYLIIGESKVFCRSGTWEETPTCQEVTCELNSTMFGIKKLEDRRNIFRAGESVEITCPEKHWFFFTKERSKSFTCKDDGEWDYEPVCEVACELNSTMFGIQKIKPKENLFRAGESVEITCSEKHWFFFTKERRKSFTCKDDGEWDYEPVCTEITCPPPQNATEDLKIRSQLDPEGPYKPGQKLYFSCTGKGLNLKGPKQIACRMDGKWSNHLPTCEVAVEKLEEEI